MTAMTQSFESRFWDNAARKYAASPVANADAYERTLERTRTHLRPEHRVLEIGAGTSSTALRLAPFVATYTATDISAEMVRIGREKLAVTPAPTLRIEQGTLDDIPNGADGFDVVLAFNALHLMGEPTFEARRINALLPEGGLFISKTACLGGAFRIMMPVIAVMRLLGKAPPMRWFTPRSLERAITTAGFDILETATDPGTIPRRFIVARKR
jgi:SAM-dependent methyltransferase